MSIKYVFYFEKFRPHYRMILVEDAVAEASRETHKAKLKQSRCSRPIWRQDRRTLRFVEACPSVPD
jgi:isochorismate hydrolase